MGRWTGALVALVASVGCVADRTRGGVQIGEEFATDEDPCEVSTRQIALDEPVFSDGSSVADALATLPLTGTASPMWNDGGDATIAVDLAWDGADVAWVEFAPAEAGATCPDPSARLGIGGSVTSSDGYVDEVVAGDVIFADGGGGGSVDDFVPAEEIGGTVDVIALLDPQIDGPFTASLEVLVHLTPGEDTHGALVAMGCASGGGGTSTRAATSTATASPPDEPCLPVEHDVANW